MSTERKEQIAFMQWAYRYKDISYYDIWHIPNEGLRDPKTGAILKMMGFKKGIADVEISIPSLPYHGLFLEFKAPHKKNKLITSQFDFLLQRLIRGYAVSVCYNAQEAINVTSTYLTGYYGLDYINDQEIIDAYKEYLNSKEIS